MQRLMTLDPGLRLGADGADEVKAHAFFEGIEWDKVTTSQAAFIPQLSDPESTDYFDPRGVLPQNFHDDEPIAGPSQPLANTPAVTSPLAPSPSLPVAIAPGRDISTPGSDDFGSFSFKNLPVLKQANDDVIRKLKTDQMAPLTHTLAEPATLHSRKRSISQRLKQPPREERTIEPKQRS